MIPILPKASSSQSRKPIRAVSQRALGMTVKRKEDPMRSKTFPATLRKERRWTSNILKLGRRERARDPSPERGRERS